MTEIIKTAIDYGFCRCSTNEKQQDINRQVKELTEAGVNRDNIYLEWEHGDAACKKELNKLLDVVNAAFSVLAILGIITDPTTAGVGDSKQAMTYEEPKK